MKLKEHTRNQKRMYRIHKQDERIHDLELMIGKLQQENKQLEKVWNIIKEENKALLTLINWAVECDFGFDNFADDEYVNWEKFEKESNDMNYIESMIYYAKKYNKMQELKQGSDNNDTSK